MSTNVCLLLSSSLFGIFHLTFKPILEPTNTTLWYLKSVRLRFLMVFPLSWTGPRVCLQAKSHTIATCNQFVTLFQSFCLLIGTPQYIQKVVLLKNILSRDFNFYLQEGKSVTGCSAITINGILFYEIF